jgi:alkylhydroperoxidase family enzyme
MARLPYIDPDASHPKVREALGRLPGLRIYRMVGHAETAFRPFLRLGGAILGKLDLSPRLRELAILRVAHLSNAEYEWVQHVAIALAAGVTQPQVEAVERGDVDGEAFDARERTVLRFTTEAVESVHVSDETFGAAAKQFTPREIVELLLTIGYYRMVATLLETTEVDLDPPTDPRPAESEEGR